MNLKLKDPEPLHDMIRKPETEPKNTNTTRKRKTRICFRQGEDISTLVVVVVVVNPIFF